MNGSVNEKSIDQEFTALHLAVHGDIDNERLVTAIMKHTEINVNEKDVDGWTPLHHACHRCFFKSVVALQNADFCCTNNDGDTPLHLAIKGKHTEIFSALNECDTFKDAYFEQPKFLEATVSIV